MTKITDTNDVDEVASGDAAAESRAAERVAEYEAAKAEHAALKAWRRDGEKGDRPATPTLDAMTERMTEAGMVPGSAGAKRRRRSSTSTPRSTAPLGVFVIDGKPQRWTRAYKLSNVAWNHTAGIEGDSKRVTTAALVELLHTLGVDDASVTPWDVMLPNGKRVQYVAADDELATAPVAKAARASKKREATLKEVVAAKKAAPSKKAPAAKKSQTSTKKPAAKKAAPAKSTAKKSNAKKVAPNFKATA